jgi:hypothetical protein
VHKQVELATLEVNRIQQLIDDHNLGDDSHAQEFHAQLLMTKAFNC